ncbi:MAG: NAD(P)H-binding protein [Balneolaceae bacterium]
MKTFTKPKIAIVIGATGLVGSHLLKLLLEDDSYGKVKVFHRRSTEVSHPKLEEHIVDFDHIDKWKTELIGDCLFSALGTTIKKAGSKEAQYKIDYTYQFEVAQAAAENGVSNYALVSSIGANANSKSFYTRIKGELDDAIQHLGFDSVLILRPSFLDGVRDDFRLGERLGIALANVVCKLPGLRKFHPIKAKAVARALVNGIETKNSIIVEADEILKLIE